MNPEEIFHAALAKPPTERADFLATACAGYEALQRRVEVLLHAHENPGSFLAEPAPMPEATLDQPLAERPGAMIGPYKLLEQIGEGGFGVVFMAEQTEPVRRNIAKVHDGGAKSSGRPYFVMELVKGVPITEFCDQNHLTPRQRLE